jgi:predicted nucleic acid-binding protein
LKRFVLDASVALSWFIDVPVHADAERARNEIRAGARAVVPLLWELEFANGVLMAERRRIIDAVLADENIAKMERLRLAGIEADAGLPATREVLKLARKYHLTVYDAAYLELAQREGLALATLDRRLKAAASNAGVEMLW